MHTFKVEALDTTGLVIATNTVTATVNNAAPPATTALFNGRASLMNSLNGCSRDMTFRGSADPLVWANDLGTSDQPGKMEFNFYDGDIELQADARFGKAYWIRINKDSRNPY